MPHRIPFICLLAAAIFAAASVDARAEDWPRWRGPHLDGISRETQWRDTFGQSGPPVAWRTQVGVGYSSFVTASTPAVDPEAGRPRRAVHRLYTMGNTDNEDTVYCLDAVKGTFIWRHSYDAPLEPKFFEGGPTATPTVDGEALYTLSRQGDLIRFDAATGEVQWSINVAEKAGVRIPGWGFSGSPLVQGDPGDLVIVNVGEAGVALNKNSGEIVWQSADRDAGYATPVPFEHDGTPGGALIIGGAKQWTAVETATGKPLWSHRWLTRYGVNAADPIVVGDGRILISSGYGKGAALLRIPPPGTEAPEVLWTSKELRTQLSPGVLIDGHVYAIDGDAGMENANLRCVELATGDVKWTTDNVGFGSVIAAGGKLIVLTAEGELIIAPASPESFTPTARAKVIKGPCWTVPVLANGRLYCRNAGGDVVCLDLTR